MEREYDVSEQERVHQEILDLERQLADAWWNEAPLERIEELEREIAVRHARAGRVAALHR